MEALSLRDDVSDKSALVGQNTLQLIAFSIGEQTYGVEITTVREIRAWNGATPLPNTREFVRGVINLRGTIVPIFDLRARFGDGQTSPTKNHVVVVMSVGDKWVGILVDAVSDILTVSKDDIHNVPEGNSIDTELLNGIVTHESRMVGLIDLHAVVSGAKMDGYAVRSENLKRAPSAPFLFGGRTSAWRHSAKPGLSGWCPRASPPGSSGRNRA